MISQRNYEVGEELMEAFVKASPANSAFFLPATRPGPRLLRSPRLHQPRGSAQAGVLSADLGLCTYADEERFFSYRRATHRGEADYGRLLSAIVLD